MRTLMIVVLLCLAGCSNWADPTKRFRQIFKDASVKVAKLADSAKDISSGKVQGTRKMMFSKTTLSYDVKKTDSTVTPLIGFIIATVPFTFAVPNAEPEKFPYTHVFAYEYKDGAWKPKGDKAALPEFKDTAEDKERDAELEKLMGNDFTSELKMKRLKQRLEITGKFFPNDCRSC